MLGGWFDRLSAIRLSSSSEVMHTLGTPEVRMSQTFIGLSAKDD
jgi:hypothetical protein